jgi:hypothetical protein
MTMAKEQPGDDPRPRTDATDAADAPDDETDEPNRDDPSTHTAALQGAAAGGAMSGAAGYAGGLLTGSEDGIGIREIPDDEDDEDTDAPSVKPAPPDASQITGG